MAAATPIQQPIRDPVLRGHQSVAALWFPADWFDEAARAARLIACWRPGASALRFRQGDLLCFATPIEQNCEQVPGWTLRKVGGVLCSAPLNEAERAVLREGDVWIVLGAEVLTLCKRDAIPLDPSMWLANHQLSLHDTYDCSVPAPAPVVLDLESRPLREVLGDAVPPASRERGEFLEALQRAHREHPAQSERATGGRIRSPISVPRVVTGVVSVIAVIALLAAIASGSMRFPFFMLLALIWVIRLIFSARSDSGEGGQARAVQATRGIPPRSKLAHPRRWRRWLARIAMTTQLARLIGRAHARHLRRVLGLFDEGNIDEALRHAIPLDGRGGSLGPSFGMPGRRSSLDLSRSIVPATSIGLEDDLREHLRAIYRQAFAKLDREGRIDEAVFVLAELLNARSEALDYLEKHKRFAQAAELALGWDMAADVIVRLHCLAGDWRRAIAVARRDNAFGPAVIQLEKRWPDAARRLREEWANALVQQGDWLGAVDAVWPVEALREKAARWLLTAESAGGRLAARAIVQRAVLLPDTLDRYANYLQQLQRDGSSWRDRQSMAEALMSVGRTPATEQLNALITPALLADHARGLGRLEDRTLRQFVQSSGDVLLLADLPSHLPGARPEALARRTEVLELEAPEAGAHAIWDAAPLDDGCFLLALGESGACVVDATGRIRARYPAPAQQLVIAHSRQIALLLARREAQWRVSRLDLAQRTVVDLGVLEFDFWAPRFDGLHWTIARGRVLRVLDTQDSVRQVVWQVPDLPGPVRAFAASADVEQIILEKEGGGFEVWSYRLPQRLLSMRDDVPIVEGQVTLLNAAGGVVAVIGKEVDGGIDFHWRFSGANPGFQLKTAHPESLRLLLEGKFLVVGASDETGTVLHWLWLETGVECVRVRWAGDVAPNVRCSGDEWLLFDARGRVLGFNVNTSARQSFSVR